MNEPTLRAVLWDMDGTIVDTEPLWMAAETELIEAHGGTWTHEQALECVGLGLLDSAKLFQAAGVDLDAEAIVQFLTRRVMEQLADAVPFRPGAVELIAQLRAAGVQTALVTMSRRAMAEQIAGLLPAGSFDVIVAGDDVERPKPFPDPYLQAAGLLGVEPRHAVAIEDSPTGVRSARAAGMTTIGVPLMVELTNADATVLWPTLAGRTIDDIRAVHEGQNQ